MLATHPVLRTPPAELREARRQWLETGRLREGLISPTLRASWQRSQQFGLTPMARAPGAPHASAAQLTRALEHHHCLVSHAKPVMEFLSEQIRDSENIVILADAKGMLLHSLGDLSFADRAARVALRPGANWHEQWRGTNAIGTSLADGQAVVVRGGEHYLERNGFLTCAAAPIADPGGQLLGAIDISGDRRSYHSHTLALVRSAARMIEHQLFLAHHRDGLQLRLHVHREGLGTVTEGLVALSDDGWIIGANGAALDVLGLSRQDIGAVTIAQALAVDMPSLSAARSRAGATPQQVRRPDGSALWLRMDAGCSAAINVGVSTTGSARTGSAEARAASQGPGNSSRAAPQDALAALDTGDATLQAVIGRARRVLDKPIALLLQGESGAGKEVVARAIHGSGPRRERAFVAVNCAALPEHLIEAELFGYRPGAYTGAAREGAPGRIREADGGTLFLDEIGDMPLGLQARLLRVLQERQVQPLGGGKAVTVDFQLICATHRRLRDEVDAGRFREDLYYRVNGLALQLPPLRQRSDLAALIATMLSDILPGRALRLAPDVAQAFGRYRWPGNLRQLINVLRTACALIGDDEDLIDWSHLPDDIAEELHHQPVLRPSVVAEIDLRAQAGRCVDQALLDAQGNMSEAARRLGISRNTLYRKLREREPR